MSEEITNVVEKKPFKRYEDKTEEEKLQDKIEEQEGVIKTLKQLLLQLIPVVKVVLPHLRKQPKINTKLLDQVEKVVHVAQILCAEKPEDVVEKQLGKMF